MERSVRILILGDPGVGKSTLASLLSGTPNSCEKWTVGCNVTVCLHHHQSRSSSSSYSSSSSSKPVFVELFDVGSCKHKQSRALFYRHVDGAILVHDTTNGKSHQNLWKWIIELQTSDSFKKVATSSSSSSLSSSSSSFNTNFSSSSSDHPSSSIPMLIVGTKIDLAVTDYAIRNLKSSIAEEYGADSLIMVRFYW